ncbi:MAG: hypothetical protein QFX35_05020 [Candidatus Verstraetearchaeota archaeon]|nr:hypothetical protein [Candidatus Verstraetearchaeota archaeon]
MYPTAITPAGLTFSIWGLIYLMLGIFAIAPIFVRQTGIDYVGKIGPLFGLSSAFNVSWLLLWHYDYISYSVIAMVALFLTLLRIYVVLDVGKVHLPLKERFIYHAPFSLYLGWITVALVVNIAAALVYSGWGALGLPEMAWGVVAIGITIMIALVSAASRRDVVYLLVIAWALLGIYLKPGALAEIGNAAAVGIIIVMAAAVASIISSNRRPRLA